MRNLLFFDIDGTLTYAGKQIPASTKEAIRRAKEAGCKIFLSTGRPDNMIGPELIALGIDGGIYSAGAKITLGEETLYDRPMNMEERAYITSVLDRYGIAYTMEGNVHVYEKGMDILDCQESDDAANSELRRIIELRKTFFNCLPVSAHTDEPIYKITFMTPSTQLLEQLKEDFKDTVNFVWFDAPVPQKSGPKIMNGEISLQGIDKGIAMEMLCKHLGCSVSDCIAFGDSMNDAAIIKKAGIGVAMGNADDATKAIADRVCEACLEDGIFNELTRLGII